MPNRASLRVLGIDPGLTRCGVGIVDVEPSRRAVLVHVSVIRTPPSMALEERLLAIGTGIALLLDEYSPDAVALERVFAQHNVRTVMGTAQASGVAMHAAAARGLSVGLHTPSEVKAAVTGYGSADKKQVATMVQRVLRLDAPPTPADASDALALALCHAWRGSGSAGGFGSRTASDPGRARSSGAVSRSGETGSGSGTASGSGTTSGTGTASGSSTASSDSATSSSGTVSREASATLTPAQEAWRAAEKAARS